MDVSAKITEVKYKPFLPRLLKQYDILDIDRALAKDGTFILNIWGNRQIALSRWVSPKRTRSYPYVRVYDSLAFFGKRVTVIPVLKDEGKGGDRDFLQWDTISLMSLLGVYVIISYYKDAKRSSRYRDKITKQQFDTQHIKEEITRLLSYQSDALHWNLTQAEKVAEIAKQALISYGRISKELGVELHSEESIEIMIEEFIRNGEDFMNYSRKLAQEAQRRESITIQPKENLSGVKATLTIENYLGGVYFFTCDEVHISGQTIYLVEGKHSKSRCIPSWDDIKDGLLKMILFTNLKEVRVEGKEYSPVAVLKLTSDRAFSVGSLSSRDLENLKLLRKEADENSFIVTINGVELGELIGE